MKNDSLVGSPGSRTLAIVFAPQRRHRPHEGGSLLPDVIDEPRLYVLGRVVFNVLDLGCEVRAVAEELDRLEALAAYSGHAEPAIADGRDVRDVSGRADREWVHGTVANLAPLLQEDHAERLVRVRALLHELEIARLEDDER